MKDINAQTNEARNFYRVNDYIELEYALVASLEEPLTLTQNDINQSVISELRQFDRRLKPLLIEIGEESPAMEQYLSILNQKLECLTHAATEQQGIEREWVNLGLGGIAFFSDAQICHGTCLQLKMVLPPEMHTIITRAQVVNCSENQKDRGSLFRVAVEFFELNDIHQQALSRHIVKLQSTTSR